MDANTLSIGDVVTPAGRDIYIEHRCVVVAIQRRRYRAEIEFPDGHRRWYPVRELRAIRAAA